MKPILIIENSTNSLKLNENTTNKKVDYVLSGVFTEFNITNRNNRIYTADEYVPHVNEMMKKKEWGVIYGEYDHPDVFDVSMKFVSHTVENAFYNKEQNRVDGEIRLLNTHYGKDAKALVDDGLPLFVSSRAAGITESNGMVKLKSLFTYDIVADPGFASARMTVKTINESLGYNDDKNIMLIESNKHQMSQLTSKYEQSSNTKLFDLTDETKTNELFNMNKNEAITKKTLSDYHNFLTKQIKENNSKLISKINEKNDNSEIVSSLVKYNENLEHTLEKVIQYMDYLAEKVQISIDGTDVLETKTDKLVGFTNYLAENLDDSLKYSAYLAEQLENSVEYSNYIAENLEKTIGYSNYIAEGLDKIIDYSDYIAENLMSSIQFSEYIAEGLDKTINYTNYIAENLDTNIGFSSYIAENLDANIGFASYIAENLDSTINYADYISECVDKAVDYSNKIAESINNSGGILNEKIITADEYLVKENKQKSLKENNATCDVKSDKDKVSKKVKDFKAISNKSVKEEEENIINTNVTVTSEKETVTENTEVVLSDDANKFKSFINDKTSNENISNKIEKLIEEAKKREASKDVKPNFYSFLDNTDIKSFESLNNDDQEAIKIAINESTGYYSRHDVLSLMRQVLEKGKPSPDQLLIDNIPADIKPIWEKVDNKMKKSIISQSKFYDISTKEKVEHFWTTRKFDTTVNENKILLESNNPFEKMNKLSDNEINHFIDQFKKLK